MLPIGAGFIFHSWWKTPDNKKGRNVLFFWFGALCVIESLILVPWGLARLRGVPLVAVLTPGFWDISWVTIVMTSPFFMMAGVVNGLALQKGASKPKGESSKVETPNVETPRIAKPTTWEAFLKQYPDMLTMTGKQIQEKAGIPICERTATNWQKYAKRNNGNAQRIAAP